jgi:capsule polysaccharide export protein KpsE/RkpR
MVPKGEAIQRIGSHIATLNSQLDAAKTQMKTAVKPGRYVLNFQINALRKELHYWKNQTARLKAMPNQEVPLWDKLGA